MGFLQQRYDNALDRYRSAVGDYRSEEHDGDRAENRKDQVLLFRHRCSLMAHATLIGLLAAILLIAALIFGALDVLVPRSPVIGWGGTVCAVVGFMLVIVAAAFVIVEGRIVDRQLDDELRDVSDLTDELARRGRKVA